MHQQISWLLQLNQINTTKAEKWTESKSLNVGSYLFDPCQAVTPAKCITECFKTRSSLTV